MLARRRILALRATTARQRFGMASRAATFAAAGLLAFTGATQAAVFTKNNTAGDLSVGTSWTNGTVPGGTDLALFNNTITAAQTDTITSAALTLGELQLVNPGGAITINGPNTLTLNGIGGIGIDMSAATQNLTFNAGVVLGASQTWNIGAGRTIVIGNNNSISGGTNSLSLVGTGALTFAGGGSANADSTVASGYATYTGTTSIVGGTVNLQFSNFNAQSNTNILAAGSSLFLSSGTLAINDQARNTNATQTLTNLTLGAGLSFINQARVSGGAANSVFTGTFTRNVGGALIVINAAGA